MSTKHERTAEPAIRRQEEMSDAVRRARYELAAKNPTVVARGSGAHVPAPSAGQHFKVRGRVRELLGGAPTIEGIVELSGFPDAATLRAVADWSMPKSGMAPLRELSREFAGDRWAQGRYLAAILSVWIDELREEVPHDPGAPATAEDEELGRYLSEGNRGNVITTIRETPAPILVRLEGPEGVLIAARGFSRDVNREGFRLHVHTQRDDVGASVWLRFPSAAEIKRIAHHEQGYRAELHHDLVLTIARL